MWRVKSGRSLVGVALEIILSESHPTLFTVNTCPDPGSPVNGGKDIDKPTYTRGESVTFTCDSGYKLVGFSQSTCVQRGDNAAWSQDVPTCTGGRDFTIVIFI